MNKCIECGINKAAEKYCADCLEKTKICRLCQKRKSIFEFQKNQRTVSGRISRRGDCIECRKTKKPISRKRKTEYEQQHPRPAIGEKFYCPVCRKTITRQYTNDVVIDHDHKTGEIRGWVCRQCNASMGMMDDDITILKRAIKWLKRIL